MVFPSVNRPAPPFPWPKALCHPQDRLRAGAGDAWGDGRAAAGVQGPKGALWGAGEGRQRSREPAGARGSLREPGEEGRESGRRRSRSPGSGRHPHASCSPDCTEMDTVKDRLSCFLKTTPERSASTKFPGYQSR